jgi:YVTN family beta-propeller protein
MIRDTRVFRAAGLVALLVGALPGTRDEGAIRAAVPQWRFAYVDGTAGSRQGATVAVIDLQAHEVVAALPVGAFGGFISGLAANRAGTAVFVSNDSTIRVLDTAGGTIARSIPLPMAGELALSEAGDLLGAVSGGSLAVVDTNAGTIVRTIDLRPGGQPRGLAIAGSLAFVTLSAAASVAVVDLAQGTVLSEIPVGSDPRAIAFNPNLPRAYVVNRGSGSVTVFDTNSNVPVAVVPIGSTPKRVSVTPDGTRAYVSFAGGVATIDTATNTLLPPLAAPAVLVPSALLAAESGKVFIADEVGRAVHVRGAGLVAPLWVGGHPQFMVASGLFAGSAQAPPPQGCIQQPGTSCGVFECRIDSECGGPAVCDAFSFCSFPTFRCSFDQRMGYRTCTYAGDCPACQP